MSTCRRRQDDAGFSLIEIVVAMGLLMVVLVASLPMFLSMLRGSITTRQMTQAKNLSQERLEQIRDLRYHVDRQNGPFLDLLDLYYTHALTGQPDTAITSGTETLRGNYVATGAASGGLPAAPYFRVETGSLAGAGGFSQTVAAQFLESDGRTPVPAARFQGTYNSQASTGADAPASLVLGVTVITRWTYDGAAKSYRTYTQVTDGRPEGPVITSQARAIAVDVSSSAADGTTLSLQGGIATLDGAQSSGSSVSGYITGALASRTGTTPVPGRYARFNLPAEAPLIDGNNSPQTSGACSWYGFGHTSVADGTASLVDGLPKAPSNVDSATPPVAAVGRLEAVGTGACGVLSFDNLVSGGVAQTAGAAAHMGPAPFVTVKEGAPSGSVVSGRGYVTSSAVTATPQQTKAGAEVRMTRPVVLFPNSTEPVDGLGLVRATLSTAKVDCVSGTTSTPGSLTSSYTLVLDWWGALGAAPPTRHTATYTYSGTGTPTVSGPAWNPTAYRLSSGALLSDLVTGTPPGPATTGALTGARGFAQGVMTLTTASTLSNEPSPGFSSVKVQLGQLTCVADDQR